MSHPTLNEFSEALTDVFRAQFDDAQVDLELVEVQRLRVRDQGPRKEPFTLLFKAPVLNGCVQSIRQLTHPSLGQFEIFLVPIDQDEQHTYLESVFN